MWCQALRRRVLLKPGCDDELIEGGADIAPRLAVGPMKYEIRISVLLSPLGLWERRFKKQGGIQIV
jgi:hypothetical protein